jgi:hypothetical protein
MDAMVSNEPKKSPPRVADVVIRLAATSLVVWVCAQIYFLSITGKEGQGKKDDCVADLQVEKLLIKDVSDALTANAKTGVNSSGVLEARKALVDYYLRTGRTVSAEIEGRYWRDDAMKASSISFEEKVTALSEVAAAMRDIGRFQIAEEIYAQLVKELRVRVEADGGTDGYRLKLASQLNNLGVTYFMWSQTLKEPKARLEKFYLAKKADAMCIEVIRKGKSTDGNRTDRENLLSVAENNQQVYEKELSFGGP